MEAQDEGLLKDLVVIFVFLGVLYTVLKGSPGA
jgi:hypothetical protein